MTASVIFGSSASSGGMLTGIGPSPSPRCDASFAELFFNKLYRRPHDIYL